jgi:hypothetical protein
MTCSFSRFAGAEPEDKAVLAQHCHGRRALRDDRWVVAHDRAGDRCHQLDLPRGLGGGPEHRPRERRMALFVEPRKEMVGNRREGEPGLLGTDRVADQGGGPCSSAISL